MPNKIDFFLIGAPRCGTTSIYSALEKKNEIYLPNTKEHHYFSSREQGYSGISISDEEFIKIYGQKGSRQLAGDCSTSYMCSKTAPERIFEHNKDAKLVAIVRNPVDRAYSHYVYQKAKAIERIPTFEAALRAEPERVRHGEVNWYYYIENGRYFKHITRYLSLFPRNQLLVILYEDLVVNPECVLRDLLSFLNLACSGDKLQHLNKSPSNLIGMATRIIPEQMKKRLRGGRLVKFMQILDAERYRKNRFTKEEAYWDWKQGRETILSELEDDIKKLSHFLDDSRVLKWLDTDLPAA